MKSALKVALFAVLLALPACGQQPDPCASAPDPAQCSATTAAAGAGSNNGLLYGAGGFLLGRMLGGGGGRGQTTVINNHYGSHRYAPHYVPRAPYRAVTVTRTGMFGSRTTTTYRPSYSGRSSWGSSYSGRSSFGSRSSFGRRR